MSLVQNQDTVLFCSSAIHQFACLINPERLKQHNQIFIPLSATVEKCYLRHLINYKCTPQTFTHTLLQKATMGKSLLQKSTIVFYYTTYSKL